jgi:hypothetical protein
MDINWRQECEAAVIERNRLIMALTAAEKRESAALSRAEAAEKRVAELEAQRDAQEWRSGDEVPHEEGWYQTFNWGMYGHLYFSGGRWSKYPVPPKHWRSVGPPPSGDDSPG